MRFLLGICSGVFLLLAFANDDGLGSVRDDVAREFERLVCALAGRLERLEPPPAEITVEGTAAELSQAASSGGAPGALWPDDAPLSEAFGDAYAPADGIQAVAA